MKRVIYIILFFLTIIPLGIIAGPGEERMVATISFNNGHLMINGTAINDEWTSNDFHSALGKPETEDDRKEGYESKGVVVWRSGDAFVDVSEFKVNFLHDDNENWETKQPFGGSVSLEGIFITSETTPDKLKSQLPQYNWYKNDSGWLEGTYKNIGVLIRFHNWKTPVWIDFSPRDR